MLGRKCSSTDGLIENFNPAVIYLKKEDLSLTKEINIIRTSPLDKREN